MRRRRALSIVPVLSLLFLGLSCTRSKPSSGYRVPGLDATLHRPILFMFSVDAWSGRKEGLPVVSVYEDGLVLKVEPAPGGARITTGRIESPSRIARDFERRGLSRLPPRIRANE